MKLEGDSLIPLYQQVMDDIQKGIENGEYLAGQKIPSESELSELYSVSRITIRRAIEELSDAGYLTKRQGKGTYVNPRKIQRRLMQSLPLQSFSQMCREVGRVPGARTIEFTRGLPRPQESALLGISEGAEVFAIRRVRTADGVPIAYETVLMPVDEFSFLGSVGDHLDDTSLYELMETHHMRRPAHVSNTIMEVVRANGELSGLLKVSIGEPILDERAVVTDADGKPIYLGHLRAVASMMSIVIP